MSSGIAAIRSDVGRLNHRIDELADRLDQLGGPQAHAPEPPAAEQAPGGRRAYRSLFARTEPGGQRDTEVIGRAAPPDLIPGRSCAPRDPRSHSGTQRARFARTAPRRHHARLHHAERERTGEHRVRRRVAARRGTRRCADRGVRRPDARRPRRHIHRPGARRRDRSVGSRGSDRGERIGAGPVRQRRATRTCRPTIDRRCAMSGYS